MCECLIACITCRCVHLAVSTMKYLLFCINTIFMVVGCILVGLGAYIKQSDWLTDSYGEGMADIAVALIVLGVFTMIISMVGCLGARDMNQKALLAYMVITFILLMCELGFAIDVIETTKSAHVYNICLKANQTFTPVDPSTGRIYDCQGFATNTFRLGSYMVWQYLWNEGQTHYLETVKDPSECGKAEGEKCEGTKKQKKAYELAAGFQESGRCCGFGTPIENEPGEAGSDAPIPRNKNNRCNPDTQNFEVNGNTIVHQLCYGHDPSSNNDDCLCIWDDAFKEKEKDATTGHCGRHYPTLACEYNEYTVTTAGKDNKEPFTPLLDVGYDGLYCPWTPGLDGHPVSHCKAGTADEKGGVVNAALTAGQLQDMKYDFPLGGCSEMCVPWGCGQVLFEYLGEKLIALGTALIFIVLLNFVGFAIAVCLVCAHRAGVGKKGVVKNGKGTEMV